VCEGGGGAFNQVKQIIRQIHNGNADDRGRGEMRWKGGGAERLSIQTRWGGSSLGILESVRGRDLSLVVRS
jgi:hypothetical protein